MTMLLRIDASSRRHDSHSRSMADYFVERWFAAHPDDEIIVRDLVTQPIPHINADTINGFYTPEIEHDERLKRATALSDELIAELKAADVILINTPMYNFSVPSALKAWIDQVVRIGDTFSYTTEAGFSGLVSDKQAYVITAMGAVFSNASMRPMDFMTPYIQTLLGFIGITNVEIIALEGTSTDAVAFESSQQVAREQITSVLEVLA